MTHNYHLQCVGESTTLTKVQLHRCDTILNINILSERDTIRHKQSLGGASGWFARSALFNPTLEHRLACLLCTHKLERVSNELERSSVLVHLRRQIPVRTTRHTSLAKYDVAKRASGSTDDCVCATSSSQNGVLKLSARWLRKGVGCGAQIANLKESRVSKMVRCRHAMPTAPTASDSGKLVNAVWRMSDGPTCHPVRCCG